MTEVRLENLSKLFGDVKACWEINLDIKSKEFFSLLGPSGCGKTTTLRLIAGLEEPTKGDIYFDGEQVTHLSPIDRNIAMVFQSFALYSHMKVFDNIAFPLKLRKLDKNEIKKKVKKTAEFLRIEGLLDRYPIQLSGGEKQRVALGRAMIREPRAFLFDEPLANLDAKLRMLMRAELKRMQKELGITTIYVTHDQIEAMTMSDRIAILNKGITRQVDKPHVLFTKPTDTWVAGFIGTPPMNLLECSLLKEGERYRLDGDGFSYSIEGDIVRHIRDKKTESMLTLGVRPKNFEIYGKRGTMTIEGKIYAVEPTGERVIVDVEVGKNLIKVELNKPNFDRDVGEVVFLKPNKIYLFDKEGKLLMM